jgi:hypothetical protein
VVYLSAFRDPENVFDAVGLRGWAMAQAIVEIVKRGLDAFSRRDLDSFTG